MRFISQTLEKRVKKPRDVTKNKSRDDAPPYELSRYVPDLKVIVKDLVEGRLSTTEFPAVKDEINSASGKSESKDESKSLRSGTATANWALSKKTVGKKKIFRLNKKKFIKI